MMNACMVTLLCVLALECTTRCHAGERLAAEAARYQGRPRPYSRLFDEQEVALRGVPGVAATDPAEVPSLLAQYREALACVVRALPAGDALRDWLAVAEAATLPA